MVTTGFSVRLPYDSISTQTPIPTNNGHLSIRYTIPKFHSVSYCCSGIIELPSLPSLVSSFPRLSFLFFLLTFCFTGDQSFKAVNNSSSAVSGALMAFSKAAMSVKAISYRLRLLYLKEYLGTYRRHLQSPCRSLESSSSRL